MEWNCAFLKCNCTSVLFAGTICVFVALLLRRRKRNFPPGPRGIPLLGYAPFLGDHAAETLRKLKSKYGPVMSVQLGTDDWLVLNDFEVINECLVKQGEKFSGRQQNVIMDMITSGGMGVGFADYGKSWKQLRKFGLMTLRGFGVGKKGMEEHIIEETPYLVEELMNDNKGTILKLTHAVANIICRVTFGSRFDYDDERFSKITGMLRHFFSDNTDSRLFGVIVAAPVLRHVPIFRGAYKRIMSDVAIFFDILRDIIKEHKETFDKDNIRDFIDAFVAEMEQRGSNDESFNELQLLQYIRDLLEAGTGTASSTLAWGLLALMHFPECQEKIAKEIQGTIGEGTPFMKHRQEMNYTCAFIHELMRHRTLVPTSVSHKTNDTAFIHGYTVPKDTPVLPNIWAVHYDPDIFENPTVFKPERFLDKDGKFVKSNHVIPFSVGPRHCLGEQLARMEVFIFLTGIIQRLKVLPDPTKPPPPFTLGVYPFMSTYEPKEFQVIFERR